MKRVPPALVALRALCGPVLLAAAAAAEPAWFLAALVSVAFVSDVFDGIIARRLGVATAKLRRADTIADTAFYLCAGVALFLLAPSVIEAHLAGVAGILALEAVRWAVERARYGRLAAYHMWSAKAWGVTLWLGFSEAFLTGRPGLFIQAAVVMGLVADAEGLLASLILSTWHHDIRTLWDAMRIEKEAGKS